MISVMVKTTVTLPRDDLEAAHISDLTQPPLRQRLHDQELDGQIEGYAVAFARQTSPHGRKS